MRWITLAMLCMTTVVAPVQAHEIPPSFATLDIGASAVEVELQLPVSELAPALDLAPNTDVRTLIAQQGERIGQYAKATLAVYTAEGVSLPITLGPLAPRYTSNIDWENNQWITLHARFEAPPSSPIGTFIFQDELIVDRRPEHEVLVYLRHDIRGGLLGDPPLLIGRIGTGETALAFDGSENSWGKGLITLFRLGMHHIAEGTDHVLFLLTLLLSAPLLASGGRWQDRRSVGDSLRRVVMTVSGFTLGHSLALAAATLGWVSVPVRWVESAVAASILVTAVHVWRPLFPGRETALAATFGLIHGLAFAETLAGLQFDSMTLAVSLLGFNLGIEAMQLLIVAAVMPLLLGAAQTRYYHGLRKAGAVLAAVCACIWLGERALELPWSTEPVTQALAEPPKTVTVALLLLYAVALIASIRQIVRRRAG